MDKQPCLFAANDLDELSRWEEMAEQRIACAPPSNFVAQFVRWSRYALHWKKETLASFAGVSLSTIERIERGVQVSSESLERVAAAIKQPKGAFTEPRVPLGLRATIDSLEKHYKQFEGKTPVNVRPLRTLPQVAELVRADMYVVDGSRLSENLSGDIGAFREWLDLGSFVIATEEDPLFHKSRREPVRRRRIYRKILDQVRQIERRGTAVALAGVYEARTNIEEVPGFTTAVVSFFPTLSDPGAIKRRVLLAPAHINVVAALAAEEKEFTAEG